MVDKKEIKRILPKLLKILGIAGASITLLGAGYTLNLVVRPNTEIERNTGTTIEVNATLELPDTIQIEAQGGIEEIYPYVESVDGGQFYEALPELVEDGQGIGAIEQVDTSSVQAFVNDTLGKCILGGNSFGYQCVSLANVFWYSYAGRAVSTCGTGLAKGMMNCPETNAGDEFKTIWSVNDIIAGTWIITGGSYTGHVCMALDTPSNGYVKCLGENQGGKSCGDGTLGSATNIINLSTKNFLGGYIPKSYIPVEPTPEVLPDTSH